MQSNRWLLPEGVQEMVPPESWRLESARRQLLDLYWRWGYDLIRPPLIEYLIWTHFVTLCETDESRPSG